MKREIKFRVWDSVYLNWKNLEDYTYTELFLDDKYIVQQYTGMKDKNGVEIYEGDILSEKKWNGTEIFGEVKWISVIDGYNSSGWDSYPVSLPRPTSTDCVVVGNIFENPELLK
jgi:uncharacterized phage protein (TIGR01671 family)